MKAPKIYLPGERKPRNLSIKELFEEGKKNGLSGNEIPCKGLENPQGLCMDELQKRIWNLPDPDDHFRGGAYSGD